MTHGSPGQRYWHEFLEALEKATKSPAVGVKSLVHALSWASRAAGTDHPRAADAHKGADVLEEQIADLFTLRTVTTEDIARVVEHVRAVANLDDSRKGDGT